MQVEGTVVFPWQHWLCERATILHSMYTACFVWFMVVNFHSMLPVVGNVTL